MNHLEKFLDNKYALKILAILTFTAFVIRLLVIIYWMDAPGDGPVKAMYAYNWSQSPWFETSGIWLPGFLYLTGLFNIIVPNPLVSIRILNLILGTLTVPVFYLLVRKIFGYIPALFAAGVLSVLPLHVGLSASSMTDVSCLFEIILGMYCTIQATEVAARRKTNLAVALFCLCLAEMTRYEVWILMPFFPIYIFWKTKNIRIAILVAFVLSILPLGWMIGNHLNKGAFLLGFDEAVKDAWGSPVGYFRALKTMGKMSVEQLEWILVLLACWGVMIKGMQNIREKLNPEQVLIVVMTGFFWVTMLHFASERGVSFQDRYLLFGMVMILSFSAIPLLKYFKKDKKLLTGMIGFVLLLFLIPKVFVQFPMKDVTRKKPTDIRNVAHWLKKSPYQDVSTLMTQMRDESTYLALYYPGIGPHFPLVSSNGQSHLIYAKWLRRRDSALRKFMKQQRPALLITSDEDDVLLQKVLDTYGEKIKLHDPIYKVGEVKVYDIKSILNHVKNY